MVASERRVGTERKFAPIRVQRLLSLVLKAHEPTGYKADFNNFTIEYCLLNVDLLLLPNKGTFHVNRSMIFEL